MSKKKAFSGSTMTLKDFHGGSIPSDLPLPSAPGVVVRPAAAFDRQIPNAWGNPNRSRPGSSGTTRNNNNNYDEKPSFFSHIGRNFDEDERKPLDGVSLPRRTVSDESISVLPARYEPKPDSPSAGRLSKRSITSPVARFSGSPNAQIQTTATAASSVPNAWGTRKDVATVPEPLHSSNWSGPNAVSRFAQASALEKVSSGRWQSKHVVAQQPDIEVIRYQEDTDFPSNRVYNSFNGMSLVSDKGDYDATRGRYAEKNSIIEDDTIGAANASPVYYYQGKERSSSFTHDVVRPPTLSTQIPAEAVERPKIKLLPRSKPVEALESPVVDYRQGYQIPLNTAHVEAASESYANEFSTKPGSPGSEGGKRAVERPRLNLKPRSQPLEQSDSITERERKSLFGGARPRELVLKERGIDDVVINNLDVIQSPNRVKQQEHPKTELKPEAIVENLQHDHKSGRKADSSWRNENNWRNNREQERRHEPDTWRKPAVEQPNSPPSDSGVRYGKAASALELAQAFSRSNSGVKSVPVPGRNQIPFSRLTAADTRDFYSGPTSRRQINGY